MQILRFRLAVKHIFLSALVATRNNANLCRMLPAYIFGTSLAPLPTDPPSQTEKADFASRGSTVGFISNRLTVYANGFAIAVLLQSFPAVGENLRNTTFKSQKEAVANYKKPEFAQPEYAPLSNGATTLLKNYAADAKANEQLSKIASEARGPNRLDQILSWGALAPQEVAPNNEVKPTTFEKVTTGINTSFVASAQTQFLANLAIVQQFKSGLKFNFSLKNLFSGDKKIESEPTAPSAGPRYGLILKGIEPDVNAPKNAAVGTINAEDLKYAGKAKAVYTIGPIYGESNDPLFNVRMEELSRRKTEFSTWNWLKNKAPSSNIEGSITPRDEDPDRSLASNGSSKKLPPLRFSLWQQEKLYTYNYETIEGIKKDRVSHIFALPVYGTLRLVQDRNEGLYLTKSTVSGILLDERRPQLNVSYMHLEKRYAAEMKYERALMQVVFVADTPPGFKSEKIFKQEKEKYEVRFNKMF